MVKIDKNLEKEDIDYQNHLHICELVDSAIIENINDIYELVDTETPFNTNHKNKPVTPELIYVSKNKNGVLLIEETSDPKNKKEQLLKYAKITHESLQMIAKTDYPPYLDIFLVVPSEKRSEALDLYREIETELPTNIGRKRGISIWYYPKSKKYLKNAGGTFYMSH